MSDSDPAAGGSLPTATKLAVDRTRLAHERTLMAWIRTAASLISFGFTIYKFFQFLRESNHEAVPHRLFGPREFAFMLILFGVVSLVIATVQHFVSIRALRAEYGHVPYSLVTVIAGLLGALGLFGLLAVGLRQ
jgi:putative membrane protein